MDEIQRITKPGCKFANSAQYDMQYIPCDSTLLAQETLFLTQKNTFFTQRFPKTLQIVSNLIIATKEPFTSSCNFCHLVSGCPKKCYEPFLMDILYLYQVFCWKLISYQHWQSKNACVNRCAGYSVVFSDVPSTFSDGLKMFSDELGCFMLAYITNTNRI